MTLVPYLCMFVMSVGYGQWMLTSVVTTVHRVQQMNPHNHNIKFSNTTGQANGLRAIMVNMAWVYWPLTIMSNYKL